MRKKLISIKIICIVIISNMFPPLSFASNISSHEWPKGPSVYAESAILIEASTGLILYEKNIHKKHYPASITKIMTTLLALENSSLNDTLVFSRDSVFNVDLNSSRIGIDVGEELTMRQALYGIMLESANEVSYAVAEHVANDIENFSTLMNQRAKELGCLNTNFVNPHGLPNEEHLTTAYDMALITKAAMDNPIFRKITSTRTYQIPPTNKQIETRYLRNHHKFILRQNYFYDDCIGGKTGYTSKAKYTLVSTAKRGDLELICVILKDDSLEHQYTDTKNLFDFGFDNFSVYSINDMNNNKYIEESIMFTRFSPILNKAKSPLFIDPNARLVLPNSVSLDEANRSIKLAYVDKLDNNESIVGEISFDYMDKFVGSANILYSNADTISLNQTYMNSSLVDNDTIVEDIEPKANNSFFKISTLVVGVLVALFLIYFIFLELPRLKRRNSYYKRRSKRKNLDDFKF